MARDRLRVLRPCKGEKLMHASFRSYARSSSKAMLAFLLICVPLLLGQNTTAPVDANKELPDAPTPVTTGFPTQGNLTVTHSTLAPRFDANRTQIRSWMGTSSTIERPAFNTNTLASKESKAGGKDAKVAGRSPAKVFSFDPIGGHTNHATTHSGTQWYTSHVPLAGSIMRQGVKISKAHPHLTIVIKTFKPKL